MRGISILLVVLSHAGNGFAKIFPGGLGVTIFFVISGFLITNLLLQEIATTGSLNLKRFYFKRVLRLMPSLLFYLVLFVSVLLYLGSSITPLHIASGIFYFANYYHIFIGYPPYNPLPILWSLAVEEHFYIIFPLLILLFRKNPLKILPFLCLLLALTPIWRTILYNSADFTKLRLQGSDAIFDCIIYGCVAAIFLHYDKVKYLTAKSLYLSIAIL